MVPKDLNIAAAVRQILDVAEVSSLAAETKAANAQSRVVRLRDHELLLGGRRDADLMLL
jgi:hypothetical protein